MADELTPEDLLQLLQFRRLPKERAVIEAELRRAIDSGSRPAQDYISPQGAILGGLGDVIAAGGSAFRQSDLKRQMADKDRQEDEMRRKYLADALRGTASGTQGSPLSGDASGAPPAGGTDLNRQAMVDALLGRKHKAQLGILSGDELLGQVGQMNLEDIQRQEGAAATARSREQKLKDELDKETRQRTYDTERDATNNAAKERRARILAGQQVAEEKRSEQRAMDREDRVNTTKKQAQAQDIEERFRGATKSLDEMEKIVTDHGTYDLTGPTNALLEGAITSWATDVAKLRDPTSVARESEVEAEKKALFSPGLGTSNDTALKLIQRQKERLKERRDEAYRVRGLKPPATSSVEAGDPAKSVEAGDPAKSVSIRRKKDGRVIQLRPADAQRFLMDGAKFELVR